MEDVVLYQKFASLRVWEKSGAADFTVFRKRV